MSRPADNTQTLTRWSLHGLAVELTMAVPLLAHELKPWQHEFEVSDWPEGFTPVVGSIQPFDETIVHKAISPDARLQRSTRDLMDIYRDGDRFWLVDDRWGMAEVDLLRGQWRSWVLPAPKATAAEVVDAAVLWPMAQLLRAKGLHLLPAASIARSGWAALILCPFNLEPELSTLVRHGYRVIGQSWTAVRAEDNRLAMLRLPGSVERTAAPLMKKNGPIPKPTTVDLTHVAKPCRHGFCDAVLSVEPGRRLSADLKLLTPEDALHSIRSAWPIAELHPRHRTAGLPASLARRCAYAEVKLSRDSNDLLYLLDDARLREHQSILTRRSPMSRGAFAA